MQNTRTPNQSQSQGNVPIQDLLKRCPQVKVRFGDEVDYVPYINDPAILRQIMPDHNSDADCELEAIDDVENVSFSR